MYFPSALNLAYAGIASNVYAPNGHAIPLTALNASSQTTPQSPAQEIASEERL